MPDLAPGRQLAALPQDKDEILASAFFQIVAVPGGSAYFAELTGITSEVEHTEYMEAGRDGAFFSRHPGRSKPPTVTLKRALRLGPSTTWLWAWHSSARRSLPTMYCDCFLYLYGPGDDPHGVGRAVYMLHRAFPSKVEVAGVKSGASEVVFQTVTLQCDEFIDPTAGSMIPAF